MKKTSFLVCLLYITLLFCSLQTKAQGVSLTPEIIASSGGYSEVGGYSLSYTVAEMTMVTTLSSGDITLTQGFQQPDIKNSALVEGGLMTLYPNPANDWFTIDYNFPHSGELEWLVYDMRGRLVAGQTSAAPYITGNETLTVNGIDWAEGIYVVRVLFTANDGSK